MNWLISLSTRYPAVVLAVILSISLVASLMLPNLQLEVSAEGMMVKDDPARLAYDASLQTFGADNITVVYLEDDNLFDPQKLSVIAKAVNNINNSPLVSSTDSLFSVPYLRVEGDYLYNSPYLDPLPKSLEEAQQLRDAAILNPMISGNLLSSDGRVLAINVSLDSTQEMPGFDEQVNDLLQDVLLSLEEADLQRVFFLGDSSVREGINQRIHEDQKNILPLSLIFLVITLAFTLKKVSGAIIPLITAGVSVIWTLGLMAASGIPLNVMTSIVPALLIIIGSTEDIHLLSEYMAGVDRGLDKRKALDFMSRNMSTAILLTFITTYFGFLSISLNSLDLLQQFGLVASTGLLLNFLVTVTLVPISLHWFGRYKGKAAKNKQKPRHYSTVALWMLDKIERFRIWVIVVLISVFLVSLYGAMQVKVNNNVMDYFDENSPTSENARILHDNLSGIQTFSIILSGPEGTFSKISRLEEILTFQEYLESSESFDKLFSFADFLSVIHSGLDDEQSGEVYLPEFDDAVNEYMSLLDKDAARSLVSPDYDQARIVVRHNIESSYELNQAVEEIYREAEEVLYPGVNIQVTGESYLNSKAVDYMADGQIKSLIFMLLVIFTIVAVLFMNPKAGLIAVVANAFPIAVLFGVMGYTGMAMDTGTAMVAAISLGVCVDHSMHFMVRYQRASRLLGSEYKALRQTMSDEATPIIATAIALSMGFGALMISEFPPVARFGLLSALVMLTALISTFLIAPIMLYRTRLLTVWDLLSIDVKSSVLSDSPLFKKMGKWQVRKLIALSKIEHFETDEVVLHELQEADRMFVILSGSAEVWKTRSDGSAYQVNKLKPGEVFGIISMAANQQRTADVVATKSTDVLTLRREDIRHVGRVFPYIANRLYENLLQVFGDLVIDIEARRPEIRDELSGAYNATYFKDLVDFAVSRANRHQEALTVMVVDVMRHNERATPGIQDNWILRETADAITLHIRGGDVFARWKGNRFLVLLPQTDLSAAEIFAERVRTSLEDPNLMSPDSADISIRAVALIDKELPADYLQRLDNMPPEFE